MKRGEGRTGVMVLECLAQAGLIWLCLSLQNICLLVQDSHPMCHSFPDS